MLGDNFYIMSISLTIICILLAGLYLYKNKSVANNSSDANDNDTCDKYEIKYLKLKHTILPVDYDKIKAIGTHSATINGEDYSTYLNKMDKPSIPAEKYKNMDPIYTIESVKLHNKVIGKVLNEYEPELVKKDEYYYRPFVRNIFECNIELKSRIDLYDDGTIVKTIHNPDNKDNNTTETYKLTIDELNDVLDNMGLISSGYMEGGLASYIKYDYLLNIFYNDGTHKISFPYSYSTLETTYQRQNKILDLLQINDNKL